MTGRLISNRVTCAVMNSGRVGRALMTNVSSIPAPLFHR